MPNRLTLLEMTDDELRVLHELLTAMPDQLTMSELVNQDLREQIKAMQEHDDALQAAFSELRGKHQTLQTRIGNAVEVLDSIRAITRGERDSRDADTIVAMINGFLESVRPPLQGHNRRERP